MIIRQGDSYYEGIEILNNAGNPVTPADILDIEITIAYLTKTYRNLQIVYRDGFWMFPLSQTESFHFHPGTTKNEVRVVWADGVVEGWPLYGVHIDESISKEVL